LNRDASISDDDTNGGQNTTSSKKYGLKRSIFFADVPPPKIPKQQFDNKYSSLSLKPIGEINPDAGRDERDAHRTNIAL
jgi:hypothetical protein